MNETTLIIEPGSFAKHFWRDLWAYRELFFVLAWRDVSVRYKQTVIGILWAFLRPLLQWLSLPWSSASSLDFERRRAHLMRYWYLPVLPWSLFSTSLADAGNSLIGNSNLISKVYFPRLIIPAAAIVTSLVDFLVSLVILMGLMAWYKYVPGWQLLLLPVFAMMTACCVWSGILFMAMTAKYRDFRYVVPFALQLALYVSPVGFSANIVPQGGGLFSILIRWSELLMAFGGASWAAKGVQLAEHLISAAIIARMLWFGVRQFRNNESTFADVI